MTSIGIGEESILYEAKYVFKILQIETLYSLLGLISKTS
jgi:hypothetical protein